MKRMQNKGNDRRDQIDMIIEWVYESQSSDGKKYSEPEPNISRHKHERKGDSKPKQANSSRTAQRTAAVDSFRQNHYINDDGEKVYQVYTAPITQNSRIVQKLSISPAEKPG